MGVGFQEIAWFADDGGKGRALTVSRRPPPVDQAIGSIPCPPNPRGLRERIATSDNHGSQRKFRSTDRMFSIGASPFEAPSRAL